MTHNNRTTKFAGPSAHGVLDPTGNPSILRLIFFNPCRAREPRLGSPRRKEELSPSVRRVPGSPFGPQGHPRANIHRLFCDLGTLQKSTHFGDPSKSTPGGLTIDPWPPLGRSGVDFRYFGGPFWAPILATFLYFFREAENLDFERPYSTFDGF